MSDQNEPKKVESKVNVRVALSWGIPWFAGMLFTMGFSPYPSGLDFWGQVVQWVFYFFVGLSFLAENWGLRRSCEVFCEQQLRCLRGSVGQHRPGRHHLQQILFPFWDLERVEFTWFSMLELR